MSRGSETVEIRLLGHPDLSVAGHAVKLAKRATTFALLAYLILRRGAPIARQFLAFTLFGDETEETALAELRRYLYLTSKALPAADGEPWIAADAETVRWTGRNGCSVDVLDFERLAADPSTHERAIESYEGDLLEDLYDDWIVAERERLRRLYLDVLLALVRSNRQAREHARAIAFARRLLTVEPWREDVLRTLMAIRYEAGDTAGALAEFASFAKRLADEMGVLPMPETRALRDAVVRGDPLPGEPRDARRGATEPREIARVLPLVGREAPMQALHARWARAAGGSGGAVLISGEGGVGKTRLCSELAQIAEAEGGRVYAGGTSAPESAPYQSIVEALRSALPLVAARRFPPGRAAVLARFLPELRSLDTELDDASAAGEPSPSRVLDTLAETVAELARPRPLLLVLEDLHWAGSATLEAFAMLARRAARSPLLVVATYRDEEAGPGHHLRNVARALRSEGCLSTLELGRLDRDAVAALVARVDGLGAADEALADRLYAYTEGNPLFLSEAIAEAAEGRAESMTSGAGVGSGIAALIAARTARLGDEARRVAEIAAVAGHGCSFELVREVASASPAAVSAAFNQLLDRRIMHEAGARSGVDYVFSHHLIGAAIYDAVAPDVRARRHARIGHVMERIYSVDGDNVAPDLARHFDRAGLAAEAARWYARAAAASASVYALDEAIGYAGRALELEDDTSRRIDLLRLRERLLGQRGERERQRDDLNELEGLFGECAPAVRFDLVLRRVLLARSLGESEAERALLEELSALVEVSGDARLRAEMLRQRAAHGVAVSRQAEARAPATEALAAFEALGDEAAQVACLGLLVDITANVGDRTATKAYLDALRERASTLADRAIHAGALRTASLAALLEQNYAESRDLTREVLPLTEAMGDRDAEALARGRLAVISAWFGDFEEATLEFDRAIDLLERTGNKRALATTLTNREVLMMRFGLFDEAQELIERSQQLLDTVGEQRTVVVNANNLSFVRLQLGDAAGAEHWASKALAGAQTIAFPVFEAAALSNLGNAERLLGRIVDGIAHMEAGLRIRREHQAPVDFADDLADLTMAYIQAGRIDDARACAEELAVLAEDSLAGAFWPQYALWAASRGFEAAGEEQRAQAFAARARDELTRFAGRIPDARARAAFLAVRANAEIAASAHGRQTPAR